MLLHARQLSRYNMHERSPECYFMHHLFYNIRESSRACYIMHHACSDIRESLRACSIMHHACYNIRESLRASYIMHHACHNLFLKKQPTFWQFLLTFLFINKHLGSITYSKTRTAMNVKISVFVICVEAIISFICYYDVCMTVPLNFDLIE